MPSSPAIFDRLDSRRVRMSLDILGRQVAISTGANNVLPVSVNPAAERPG
jgi:hypothetical protein